MALSSNALTGSQAWGEYTPNFLLTWPTIQKSKLFWCPVVWVLNGWEGHHCYYSGQRALPLSALPDPQLKFHHTGFLTDLAARLSHIWTYLLDKIKLARKVLYMLGRPLKGLTVETLLKGESLVPTLVRNFSVIWCISVNDLTIPLTTLFASSYHPWDSNVPNDYHRLTAWVQAWHTEVCSDTPTLNHLCCPYSWDRHFQWIGNRTGLDNLCR